MSGRALWQLRVGDARRWARGRVERGPEELLPPDSTLEGWLAGPADAMLSALSGPAEGPVPLEATIRAPVGGQEVWAAGVTYSRSRQARREESTTPDPYDRVYEAERPELFLKAPPGRVRGPGEAVGIRGDSSWDVPEPELGLVANAQGEIVAYVIGNDLSSRSLEGENPLYLPQAKIYLGSCALGPCLVPAGESPEPREMEISERIVRNGADAFSGRVMVAQMRRTPTELVSWLFGALDFPIGVILLTGTGIVPGPEFTLAAGDEVAISITGLGELRNTVEIVGGAGGTTNGPARSAVPGTG
ncbi:MAG: fumarylacetoacetate hydrolase family protein [Acidimicrobiia bacterium]